MMKPIVAIAFITLLSINSLAQKADGTIGSLVKTELNFNKKTQKKGINKAYYKFIDKKEGVTFKPNLIKLKDYYAKKQIVDSNYLWWQPQYGMISKKGDLAFITGPMIFGNDNVKFNGHYLSIWKNDFGIWKLALQMDIKHPGLENNRKPEFYNPSNYNYPKLLGPKKIQMREEVVFSTDELLGKSIKLAKNKNLAEFYDLNARLYFPENTPLIGKEDILNFIKKQKLVFENSAPTMADRALSGDLAYTYGQATISNKNYNYTRVWKLSTDMKWNIIVDMYKAKL